MIQRSEQFDLGLDRTRIKDPRDAARQSATVDVLLERLFHPHGKSRWEVQILADEVGMGKTFVGLGTAYSVLEAMRTGSQNPDLRGCYQKVLIVTPNNAALFGKWRREVGEFVKRCVKPEYREDAARWFAAASVERVDELINELRRPGTSPRVIVASTSIFSGGRLRDYDLKRRLLLRTLFRHWRSRFKSKRRHLLLKGAPEDWPRNYRDLDDFTEREWDRILFSEADLLVGLSRIDRPDGLVETLRRTCKEIASPFVRNRDQLFQKVEHQLIAVYRAILTELIQKHLPLVIVDEAHNWKNGPQSGANGYHDFVELIARRSRRVLLMTATPFQLRPSEMLEILKVGDALRICPTEAASQVRRERLAHHREKVIRPVLESSARASGRFARAWAKLPSTVTRGMIEKVWQTPALEQARGKLQELARQQGVASNSQLEEIIDTALSDVSPEIRQLLREGLRLYVYNADLSQELGAIVVRHRRHTEHRLFRVGEEYTPSAERVRHRPDRHLLHAAPGVDVRGDGELPHYLLMRCVSEMKGGKGRSSLGSALTGCYSTLVESAEGRAVKKHLSASGSGQVYFDLLTKMVDTRHDARHPKVRAVVEATLNAWQQGEKTLIFCFRTNTARRLHEIIDQRIREELGRRQERCLGGPESLKTLRTRLTGRDRDLVVIGLDRVLWSLLWNKTLSGQACRPITPDDLELLDEELSELARISIRYKIDLRSDRVDRVFLHRATEYLIANRLLRDLAPQGELHALLKAIADDNWVRSPYGLSTETKEDGEGAEAAHFDERGVHTVYEADAEPSSGQVTALAEDLLERRVRARRQGQLSVFDSYGRGPNLWVGFDPRAHRTGDGTESDFRSILEELHHHLFGLSWSGALLDWDSRRLALQAIRSAVFRESVLLRLLPEKHELDEGSWGELLVRSFFAPLPQQRESMAHRVTVFLEDLVAASGRLNDTSSARFALYEATKLRDQQFVALVFGETDQKSRERVFSGFNSPLLPEVLICTSVGQEGIDLHRHCRNVVHFDLAWNPAVLEQRTGRADRIGSKTFRERALSNGSLDSFLEIGVPYLAGTYDERMYEELRLRAQTFEVLTGGELAASDAEGYDDHKQAEGQEAGLRFVPLPDSLVEGLRVNLHVWTDNLRSENRTAG